MKLFKLLAAAAALFFCALPGDALCDPVTVSSRHEYRISSLDDEASARLIASERAAKILLDEAAGRLAGYADIGMLHLERRELAALAAPLARIDVTGEERRDGMLRVQASVLIEPSEAVRFLNSVLQSPARAGELREIRKRTNTALAEIDRIGKGPDPNDPRSKEAYRRALDELALSGHSLRGWRLSWFGRYREAVEEFSEALSRRADQAEIWRQRGAAWLKLKDRSRALADFNRALEIDPRYAHAYANRGYVYLESGEPEKAVLDFNRALELKRKDEDPDPADEYSAASSGAVPEKQAETKPGSTAKKPPRIETYRQMALNRLGPPKPDPTYFTSILEKNPAHAAAWYGRGLAYQSRGLHRQALDDFNRAIRLMPENPTYYQARAGSYAAMKLTREAIEDYGRAITLNAQLSPAYFERGLLYSQKGDYKSAAADFERTAELEPGHPKAAALRDAAFSKLGQKPDIDYLNKVIADNPHRPYAYFQRALAYWEEGFPAQAIEDCTAALRLTPDDARAYLVRGVLYAGAGDYQKALADHDRALALAPGDLFVFGSRLKAYGDDRRAYDKSLAEYRKILSLHPGQAVPILYRGVANFFLGKYEDAMIDCRKAIGLDPSFAAAYRWHGMVHHVLGNYELAIRYYDQAVTRAPKDPLSHYLRGLALSGLDRTSDAVASLKEADGLGLKAAKEELRKLKY